MKYRFYFCDACQHIITQKEYEQIAHCKRCKSSKLLPWPHYDECGLNNYLVKIKRYELKDDFSIFLVSLFLCVLMEELLERLNFWLTEIDLGQIGGGSTGLVTAIFKAYKGKERLIDLYKILSGKSFIDAIKKHGYTKFWNIWNRLCENRNFIAHKPLIWEEQKFFKFNKSFVNKFINTALDVYVILYNEIRLSLSSEDTSPINIWGKGNKKPKSYR